ncbi:Uncharacterized protein HZ326_27781 [Fusarium oxysporum f. sp. albedinis]|nr:Uncharacterized protein HZ326_27781 [Fusarium oxysporum f. sp. albedinis]
MLSQPGPSCSSGFCLSCGSLTNSIIFPAKKVLMDYMIRALVHIFRTLTTSFHKSFNSRQETSFKRRPPHNLGIDITMAWQVIRLCTSRP